MVGSAMLSKTEEGHGDDILQKVLFGDATFSESALLSLR